MQFQQKKVTLFIINFFLKIFCKLEKNFPPCATCITANVILFRADDAFKAGKVRNFCFFHQKKFPVCQISPSKIEKLSQNFMSQIFRCMKLVQLIPRNNFFRKKLREHGINFDKMLILISGLWREELWRAGEPNVTQTDAFEDFAEQHLPKPEPGQCFSAISAAREHDRNSKNSNCQPTTEKTIFLL